MRSDFFARWVVLLGLASTAASAQSASDAGAGAPVDARRDDDVEARRQRALEVYREELARCVADGRCEAIDPFALLPRSMRPWARRGRGRDAAWAPPPFAGVIAWSPPRLRTAISDAMATVLELDARPLDAPPPAYVPHAAASARRRWALRALAPWIDAQVHALTVLTAEMREARQLDPSVGNIAPVAIVAERYAQLADRLEQSTAPLTPADLAALDAARGGPLPPPSVLRGWAREGFAACRSAAQGARRSAEMDRCERGLAAIDRAARPEGDAVTP